jgi:class 3 adenylate cyclase
MAISAHYNYSNRIPFKRWVCRARIALWIEATNRVHEMTRRLSLGHVVLFALLFGAFFALTSAAQYVFVRHTSLSAIRADLKESAGNVSKATAYDGGIDPAQYVNAYFDAWDFIAVLGDGSILNVWVGLGRPISEVLPPVRCPILTDTAFDEPVSAIYQTETIRPETWTIRAKRVQGGVAIMGLSAHFQIASKDEVLAENLERFGDSIKSAARVNLSQLGARLAFAVIDDANKLIFSINRFPLKTNAMMLAKMSTTGRELISGGRTYYTDENPLTDIHNQHAGSIIGFMDITLHKAAVHEQLMFSGAVSIGSFIIFLILAAYYSARQEREKQDIREAFQHYFSPQIMEAILRDPKRLTLGGQRREVTILFSDIRSFTSLTEKLPPHQLTALLREYFDAMTEEVFATEGIVDKYVGDAIMAFWGAPIEQPDQADRAVKTAVNMVRRLKELRKKWEADGLQLPREFEAGIGINLGIATVGNLGSSRRFDYTLIGDAVNAASRIEQLNKDYKSHIIISDTTKAQLTLGLPTKDLGAVEVRGKQQPIRVFEVEVGE